MDYAERLNAVRRQLQIDADAAGILDESSLRKAAHEAEYNGWQNNAAEMLFLEGQAALAALMKCDDVAELFSSRTIELAGGEKRTVDTTSIYDYCHMQDPFLSDSVRYMFLGVDGVVYVCIRDNGKDRLQAMDGTSRFELPAIQLLRKIHLPAVESKVECRPPRGRQARRDMEEKASQIRFEKTMVGLGFGVVRTPCMAHEYPGSRIIEIESEADALKAFELRGGDSVRVTASNVATVLNIIGGGVVYIHVSGVGNTLWYDPSYAQDRRLIFAPHQAEFEYEPWDC